MPPGTSHLVRDLVEASVRLRHELARRLGVNDHEMRALDHLSRGPAGPAELARLLEVSTAASTGIVDRLSSRGHVARHPHPDDRRRTVVELTDHGRAEVLTHLRPMLGHLGSLDAGLDDDDRAVVHRFLRGATAAFDAASETEPSPPGQASGVPDAAPPGTMSS